MILSLSVSYINMAQTGLEKLGFWKVFRLLVFFRFRGFLGFSDKDQTHFMTQEEHPIHHSRCHIIFCKLQQNSPTAIRIWNLMICTKIVQQIFKN